MKKEFKRGLLILAAIFSCFSSISCTPLHYSVVGSFNNYNEIFLGEVENNLWTGDARIEVKGQNSHINCGGSAVTTYVPPYSFGCAGQSGEANLACDDGRIIEATYRTLSCSRGIGSGYDQDGNKFTFTFGMPQNEALVILAKESARSMGRPELPPIYKPKEVRKEKGFATGTGFLISNDGFLITNYHVIEDAKRIFVQKSDGERVKARIVKVDPQNDVALLKAEIIGNPLSISYSSGLSKGQEVLTLGYPLVMIQGQEQKASFGRINALSGIDDDIRFLQVDVPIQPGNSGGPLIDLKGQVVGVMTATLNQLETLRAAGSLAQNVNYAIKSDYFIPLIKLELKTWDMKNDKQQKWKIQEEIIKELEHSVFLIVSE